MVRWSTPIWRILLSIQIFLEPFLTICSTWVPQRKSSWTKRPRILWLFCTFKYPEVAGLLASCNWNSGGNVYFWEKLNNKMTVFFSFVTWLFLVISLWNLNSSCCRTFSSGSKIVWVLSWNPRGNWRLLGSGIREFFKLIEATLLASSIYFSCTALFLCAWYNVQRVVYSVECKLGSVQWAVYSIPML